MTERTREELNGIKRDIQNLEKETDYPGLITQGTFSRISRPTLLKRVIDNEEKISQLEKHVKMLFEHLELEIVEHKKEIHFPGNSKSESITIRHRTDGYNPMLFGARDIGGLVAGTPIVDSFQPVINELTQAAALIKKDILDKQAFAEAEESRKKEFEAMKKPAPKKK